MARKIASAPLRLALLLSGALAGCEAPDQTLVPDHLPASFRDGAPPPPREWPELAPLVAKVSARFREEDAVDLALSRNPDLEILRKGRSASRARLYQAQLYVYNPAAFVGLDDLPVIDHHASQGLGPYPGKYEFGIVQQVEFPTKRGRRIEVAEAEARVADADFAAKERDTRAAVRTACADILVLQDRLGVAERYREIATRLHAAATARVAASAAPAIEETKAEADELRSRNEAKAAERDVSVAKARLAELLGDPALVVGTLDGALALHGPELVFEGAGALDGHPALASKGHAVDSAAANVGVQRAAPWPDPIVTFTYNRVRNDTDRLTANLLIPLPVFNSNRGRIREAELDVERAEADLQSTRSSLVTRYRQAVSTYETARSNARLARTKTLPVAERSLALAEEGWKAGKFRYLDVLDAERTLTTVRADYVTALQDLSHAIIQIEALTGKRLDELAR